MTRGRKPKKKGKFDWLEIESEVISSVVGIIILAFGLIILLAHIGVASGWFSSAVSKTLTFLFGNVALLFPLILFVIAAYILVSHKPKVIGSAIFGGLLTLLGLLGLCKRRPIRSARHVLTNNEV